MSKAANRVADPAEAGPLALVLVDSTKRRRKRKTVTSVKIGGKLISADDVLGDSIVRCVAWTLRELSSPFVMFDTEQLMVGGNFVAALDWAVFEQQDSMYVLSILLRFRHVMCCADLFTTLKVLFAVRKEEAKSRQELQDAQRAMGDVLALWMSLKCTWQNIGPSLYEAIVEWMVSQHLASILVSRVQLQYVRSLALKRSAERLHKTMKELEQTAKLGNKVLAMLQAGNTTLDSLSARALATNLTMLTWHYFVSLRPFELYRCAWQKSNKATKAPYLCKLADLFNKVSFWVASEVITHAQEGGMSAAVAVTVKFIDIADELCALNNFNILAAILAGLNLHSIERVKALWSEISPADHERLEELNSLVSPQQNYKTYRSRVKSTRGRPVLPYIAVYLRDLTFIEDGNRATVQYRAACAKREGDTSTSDGAEAESDVDLMDLIAPDTVLNVEKELLLGCSMYRLLCYQQLAYELPINPQVMIYLLVVDGMDEDTLYEKSVLVQPVGSEVATGVAADESVLDQIPPTKWKPAEVAVWLRKIGIADLKQQFVNVNGRSLLSMQSSDLDRLGVVKLGARVRLMKAINQLNEWEDLTSDADANNADPSKARTVSSPMARSEISLGLVANLSEDNHHIPRRRASSKRKVAGRATRSTGNLALSLTGISSPNRSSKNRFDFLASPPNSWTASHCKRYIRLCPELKCVQGKRLHRHSLRQLQVATPEMLSSWGISKEEDRQAVLRQFEALQQEFRGLPLQAKPVAEWSEEDVLMFLALLGASEYEALFTERHMDGKLLVLLGHGELAVLGVQEAHRSTMLAALQRHTARLS